VPFDSDSHSRLRRDAVGMKMRAAPPVSPGMGMQTHGGRVMVCRAVLVMRAGTAIAYQNCR
jgi:hypothetical protein